MFDFKLDKSIVKKINFNPYYNEIQSELGNNITVNNNKYINLAANNYLGLANDKRIKQAAMNAINKYGLSLCGTPIATGYTDLFKSVEKKISNFIGLDDAIIFPSCYQANNGLFNIIVNQEDIVFVDHYAHSSLIQGIKNAGCKISPFLHNNINHLENLLKKSKEYKNAFVVTESVFSTEGNIAPINEIYKLSNKYNAKLIIDDSHGIGVIGENGKGILDYYNINNFNGIYTASLGKAIANSGGVICGDKVLIEYLRYNIPHLIYSTAIVPSILGGILKTIEILEKDFIKISKRMFNIKDIIKNTLKKSGFNILESKSAINSIFGGNREITIMIAKLFFKENILVTPFIEPSVPINKGVVRLIAQANLNKKTISEVVNKIKRIGKKYNETLCNI